MKTELSWHGKMKFEAQIGGHSVFMDANPPFGEGAHPTPKQYLLTAMASCSAMDVVSLLKKHKQDFQSFKMAVNAEAVTTQPQVFHDCVFEFYVEGAVDPAVLKDSIHLSLSKYCSVSAMVSKVVPIRWKGFINSQLIAEGHAEFSI